MNGRFAVIAALSVATIAVVNVASWYTIGRESILLTVSDINDETCPFGLVDALYLQGTLALPETQKGLSAVSDFSPRTRERLLERLDREEAFASVAYSPHEIAYPPPGDSVRLAVLVDRRTPLLAETQAFFLMSWDFAFWSQKWVWLFGWHRLGTGESGCS